MENDSTRMLIQRFFDHNLEAAARILEDMTEEQAAEALLMLPVPTAIRLVKHLQVGYAATLLQYSNDEYLSAIISQLEPQVIVAILIRLPPDARERMSRFVSGRLKQKVSEFLDYPEGSVGRTMTTDFIALRNESLVEEAINKIRSLAKSRFPSSYVYVVDADEKLAGVLNMRDLLIADSKKTLIDISRKELFTLHCFTDETEAANELAKRRFFAASVVDSENHILGIVKAEGMIQGVQEETTKDIQTMFGAGRDERVSSSISFSLKKRLPWLHINLITAFMAAAIVAAFEGIIAKIIILAVFLPVVAGQGGNAGAQSLAVV